MTHDQLARIDRVKYRQEPIDGYGVMMDVPNIATGDTLTMIQRFAKLEPSNCPLRAQLLIDDVVVHTSADATWVSDRVFNFGFAGPIVGRRMGMRIIGYVDGRWVIGTWMPAESWWE